MQFSRKIRKRIAAMLLIVLSSETLAPNVAMALTTGPSQPEVQGFEPVGTTDMVDMFSGDFVYNIPLMDVEGYPVNISYHGGVTMEQEASWVGLGWNINPGEINRMVRGLPDDFNGDTVSKELNIKDEKTLRVGLGVGGEIAGMGDPFIGLSLNAGVNLNISNYRGVSSDFSFGGGINLFRCASAGVNIGVGSQTGATIDYNAGLSLSSSLFLGKDISAGIGVSRDGGYNTRTGIKELNFSKTLFASAGGSSSSITSTKTIPISLQNLVPVITNSSTMNTIYGRVKLGGELTWLYGYGNINGAFSKLHYNNDGSRDAYGYLYLENATSNDNAILDFTRDKDGLFNKSMQYLPSANMTYDVYSVSGQGTGGVFRPFRNDFGSVFDPATYSTSNSRSLALEVGIGNLFELGIDYTESGTEITSGPWQDYKRNYTGKSLGSIYENVYLKQAGELSAVSSSYLSAIGGLDAITPDQAKTLPLIKPNSDNERDPRSNLIGYSTGAGASATGVGGAEIHTYRHNDFSADAYFDPIHRVSGLHGKDLVSSICQTQTNGARYIYGLPVMNNIQKEVTFSVKNSNSNLNTGLVKYDPGTDDAISNPNGIDNYYSSSVTPAYAHSYLLTSVLPADYVDVKGDGPTDDDLGSYTKFKYTRTSEDYRWKAPFSSDSAQYNPGFYSDKQDDKASYVAGSREQWVLHSIETKNFIAEFYTSEREDALGSGDKLINSGKYAISPYDSEAYAISYSQKLDSIKLYNKHERFVNGSNAIPVKTVFFAYDYSLCPGVPNTTTPGSGKLTLQRIYFRYGNSDRSMISPYQFTYGFRSSTGNPSYNQAEKDRWGNYKPNQTSQPNFEFPYVNQNDPYLSEYSVAWSLNIIKLPSGGVIHVIYEPDDYAYVQNKPAQEMFSIKGIGSGPSYNSGNLLYQDKNNPYLYAYFERTRRESRRLSFKRNYLGDQTCLYYNFNVKLSGKNSSYEPIRGYATVEEIGPCSDSIHGYIKLKAVTPTGGGADLHPISYTALNVGRYNLPQIIFPGSDPDESDLHNILVGLKSSFEELVGVTRSPIIHLVKKNQARVVNLDKSFIRLQCVGMFKKGGGQRVRGLGFYDSWAEITASTFEQSALYGKNYDYTINEPGYGLVSSGVASYEPLIGGDENPYRTPVDYTLAPGSNWPPNDPVDLYQENPIGESLFPLATVGYRKITVSSMNAGLGKSSQGVDIYQFYTAKDFPIEVKCTTLDPQTPSHYDLFSQKNLVEAKQGFCLIFNDMHGKPKSIEHRVYKPASGTMQLISSQEYNYKQSGGKLDNNVNCFEYVPGTGMTTQTRLLGIEADITIDTRRKNEVTRNFTFNTNLNVSAIGPYVIPIPLAFPWSGNYQNQFQCATVTKVIQQYGILDNVRSNAEGAITTVKNEIFDPYTGNVVVTSVNNEYHDNEYSVDIPAYWAYLGMAPAYKNVGYSFIADTISIDSSWLGRISNVAHLNVGDMLFLSGGVYHDAPPLTSNAWVMGSEMDTSLHTYSDTVLTLDTSYYALHFLYADTVIDIDTVYPPNFQPPYVVYDTLVTNHYDTVLVNEYDTTINSHSDASYSCAAYVLPRYPTNTDGWQIGFTIPNVRVSVLRSGALNMLNDVIESYSTMSNPVPSGRLPAALSGLINLSTRTFCDSNSRFIGHYIANPDTVNPFALGERGVYRLLSEYAFLSNRNYDSTSVRKTGLFDATNYWTEATDPTCLRFPYNYLMPNPTPDIAWKKARTVTKYSPNGKEVENVDAIGNYSTAVYGYNEELPIAVASNARQGEIVFDGFEDYSVLNYIHSLTKFDYGGTKPSFSRTTIVPSVYDVVDLSGGPSGVSISSAVSHTGHYSVSLPSGSTIPFALKINTNSYPAWTNKFNFYYPPGTNFNFTKEYLPFGLVRGHKYVLSYWINSNSPSTINTKYNLASDCGVLVNGALFYPVTYKTNLIDGWQQIEVIFNVPSMASTVVAKLPASFFIDDLRVFPYNSNMKSFVYNPLNEKLMATLDENNFATMYEYDQEGNLIRTKRETEKGIMTTSESRSQNRSGL